MRTPFQFSPPLFLTVLLGFLCLLPSLAHAALPGSISSRAEISVVTEGPGQDLYLAFGHTAVRVRDPGQDLDLLFNYGTIDPAYFSDPTFVMRFLMGNLRYSLGVSRFEDALEWDKQTQNRTWTEQVLDLDGDQRQSVYRFLVWNAQPENRQYQYDFIMDNCSSRVPKVLEEVLGPIFDYGPPPEGWNATARTLIEASLTDRTPWNVLVTLGLGAIADRPITPRAAAFMPEGLRSLYANATIRGPEGVRPLVSVERVIYTTRAPRPAASPLPLFLGLSALAVAVLAFTLWPRKPAPRLVRRWWTGLGDRLWLGLVGVGGLLSFYLTFFSLHYAARDDFHLLWMWPTHLVMACLPGKESWTRWTRWYWLAAAVVTVVAMLTYPWWPQRSLPAALPLMAILAVRAWAVYRRG